MSKLTTKQTLKALVTPVAIAAGLIALATLHTSNADAATPGLPECVIGAPATNCAYDPAQHGGMGTRFVNYEGRTYLDAAQIAGN